MMRFVWRVALAIGLFGAGGASAIDYVRLVPDKSQVVFVSKQMGVPVEGRFPVFTLNLAFDPKRLAAARAKLEIDLRKVDAGYREANQELVGKDWFDAQRYPLARFESSSLRKLDGDRYELQGRLFMKGREAALTLPVRIRTDAQGARLEGNFVLKRLQWDIGRGPWGDVGVVADDVEIRFSLLAAPAG